MASTRTLVALTRARPTTVPVASLVAARVPASSFSTTTSRTAVGGPPPPGFRLPRQKRWDESAESSLDKAGNYFLLTELFRGMYVVLEQFFRPP